jgi:hypothetical protein
MDTYVSYVYYEKNTARYHENLSFFLKEGIQRFQHLPNVHYNLVINGHKCEIPLPDETPTFTVTRRDNRGYDYGGHAHGLRDEMKRFNVSSPNQMPYKTYVFLNGSQRGPFLPVYWDDDEHWSHAFSTLLKTASLVGSSLFVHSVHKKPVIESWAMALRPDALQLAFDEGILRDQESKVDAILSEERLTETVLRHGLAIDCLLLKFRGTEWSLRKHQQTNNFRIPSRPFDYEGININPLETIFYKTYWETGLPEENNYECPVEQRYTQWVLGEPENGRDLVAPREVSSVRPITDHTNAWIAATVSAFIMGAALAALLLWWFKLRL